MSGAYPGIHLRHLLLALLFLTAPALAQQSPEDLDEVTVTAERASLTRLRQAAEQAEDAFYARYNQVNTNDDFDMNCHVETVQRFREHHCVAAYVERAKASDARMALAAWKNCDLDITEIVLHGGCGFIPSADDIAEARKKDLAENLLRAVHSDARLQQLVKEHERLEREIQKAREKALAKWRPKQP